ncbi:MAG: DUF4349 domain-containing protein [Erysipelotrichaceae bacterium]|nr:DUF4349 domain-containing protein [Erysipelotrichaceae bacterium]
MKCKKPGNQMETAEEAKEEPVQEMSEEKQKPLHIPWLKTAVLCTGILLGIFLGYCVLNGLTAAKQTDMALNEPAPVSGQNSSMEAVESAASDQTAQSKNAADQNAFLLLPAADQAKRVYRANLSLQTQNYDHTVQTIESLAEQAKGFVSSESSSSRPGELKSGFYEVRIPTDSLNAFLEQISEKETVISSSKSLENITKSYYDAKSLMDSLTREKERLTELMDKAETVSDLTAIESRMSEVERQIQSAQQNLSAMDLDLEYSTVSIDVQEVTGYDSVQTSPWSRIPKILQESFNAFINGIGSLFVCFLFALPWLLSALAAVLIFKWLKKKQQAGGNKSGKEDQSPAKKQ